MKTITKIIMFCLALLFTGNLYAQNKKAVISEKSVLKTAKNLDWGKCPSFMPDGCNVAVLHGDPTKKNADAFFKFEPGYEIPNHWHNSAERMILIQGELQVTYSGETTQIMKAGSYAYGPAKKDHTGKCISKEPCILFVAFEDPVDAFASH